MAKKLRPPSPRSHEEALAYVARYDPYRQFQAPIYSKDDLLKIIEMMFEVWSKSGTLPLSTIKETLDDIRGAAEQYQVDSTFEPLDQSIKKPSAHWRATLKDLRINQRSFRTIICGERVALLALRHGFRQTRYVAQAGRRWLHFLEDNPRALRAAIDLALGDPFLKEPPGRKSKWPLVAFVRRLNKPYGILSGRPLARSISSDTKKRQGGRPTGKATRFVRACAQPVAGKLTDHQIDELIRAAQKRSAAEG